MYHAIGKAGEPAGRYIVPAKRFGRQLAWLRASGHRILALEDLLRHRRSHQLPPARAVVLTFDDGYRDNHHLAWPMLRRRGAPATMFLVTQCIGETNRWDSSGELAARPLLTWTEARELASGGVEIGAHTRRHPVLPDLPYDARADEIAGSRADLEGALGSPVRAFAYPYGRLDGATVEATARAGFECACSARSGRNDPGVPSHELRRLEVRGTDTLLQFALLVWRGGRAPARRPTSPAPSGPVL
jgi:peptidoglycan/xylan/chitin deacetylase (PgdA/CDA1 family)